MKMTVSVVQGKGHIRHNNRDIITKNVDQKRIQDNIIFKQEKLETAYEKLFGTAIKEYDEKQKRTDRKIGSVKNYMNKIKNSKNGEKLFYENVIQIGSKFDFENNPGNWELAKNVLTEYINDWKERNSNLYVFNAVLHMDEASPHLHIDYIPVAKDYKNGMQVRNSLDKSLKQQGIYGTNSKKGNSTINWHERERKAVGGICLNYGVETIENDVKTEHLSVEDYKKIAKINEQKVRSIENKFDIKYRESKLNKNEIIIDKKDLEHIIDLGARYLNSSDLIEELTQKNNNLENRLKGSMFLQNQLKSTEFKLEQAEKLKKQWYKEADKFESKIKYIESALQIDVESFIEKDKELDDPNKAFQIARQEYIQEMKQEAIIKTTKGKNLPKKPIIETRGGLFSTDKDVIICPTCKFEVQTNYKKCIKCKQVLDWSDFLIDKKGGK